MANKLRNVAAVLQSINDSGRVQGIANGVAKLGQSMQTMSAVKTSDFTRLTKNIEKLGNIDQSRINATASAIRTISNSLTASTGLTSGATNIANLATSISKLGYKSANNAITNIPLMATALKDLMRTLSTSPQVSKNLINMTNSLANLASQGSKVRTATNSINSSVKGYSGRVKEATATTRAFTFSIAGLLAKLYAIKRVITGLWGSVEKSMDYTETINLFQTSFKKIGVDTAEEIGLEMGSVASEQFGKAFIDRATNFNKRITEALSLDPNLMMNYQAVFAQMSNSMNLTAASALNISESFTLLGNDIASLWNIDTDKAMKKLQSGLAGQIRPLRELGVDISKTSLEMYALKYGITDSVEKMSQAAKVQLRWLAIMEQTEVAFGDMSKTISSPSNQLRVLRQQWTNLSRSMGNVFLPVVTTVLPYINAVVISLRRMIDTFATAVGFELPDYSDTNIFKDVTGDIEGIGEEADGAKEFVDGLKKSLMSFDELNILSSGKKGINLGIDNLGDGYNELDDAINKKTVSYMQKFNEEMAKMQNKAEELANKIQPKLEKFVEWMDKISPILKGIGGAFVAYKVTTWFGELATKLGALNPKAGVVFLAIGAIIAIYEAFKKYNEKLVKEDLAQRFGDITLSMEEIEDVAERLTTSEYTVNIDVYVTEKQKLNEIEGKIKTDIETLNKLNWKVSVGMGLTEGEVEQYKSTIESFISNAEAYMEQQQYVANLAINAVIQDDEAFNTEITDLVNRYFEANKKKMNKLGANLRSEYDEAFADGVLDAKEREVIGNLISEYNEVLRQFADAEFKATMQMITIDGKLTPESFEGLTKQAQANIDKRMEAEEKAYRETLIHVNLATEWEIDEAKTEEEKTKLKKQHEVRVQNFAEEFSKTKARITFEGMTFAYDTLRNNYKDGFDGAKEVLGQELKDWLSEDWYEQYINSPAENTISGMVYDVQLMVEEGMSSSGLNKAARSGLDMMLDGLSPTRKDLKSIYDEALESGGQVEKGLSDALTSDMTMRALSGSMDGIWYLMGQKLSTDKNFLDALSKAENAGLLLNEDIIRGLKSGIPDLRQTGNDLIFEVDKAIRKASSTASKTTIPISAGSIIGGFNNQFSNDTTTKGAITRWLDGIGQLVRTYKLPTMEVNIGVNTTALEEFRRGTQAAGVNIKGYADGGQPNTGEVFMARENGIPEYVGRMGGKTTVANNADISAGIEEAAYRGYVRAVIETRGMSNNSTPMVEVPLYIDGDELARGVYKAQQSHDQRMNPVRLY